MTAIAPYAMLSVADSMRFPGENSSPWVFVVWPAILAYAVEALVIGPALVVKRTQLDGLPWTPTWLGMAGGLAVSQFLGLPTPNWGPLPARVPVVVDILNAVMVFAVVATFRSWLIERWRPDSAVYARPRRGIISVVIVLSSWLVAAAFVPDATVFWQEPARIKRYLLEHTPLGSPEEHVVSWLEERGVRSHINRWPPSAASGAPASALIHESIEHHRILFRTDVEAFYVFDGSQQLVDVRVRKTTDAL